LTKATKKEYVDACASIIGIEGVENVTTAKVAKSLGVTNAALYQHFDSLDHLIKLASVHFMVPYAHAMQELFDNNDYNPMELNLKIWETYATYAFKEAVIFATLFTNGEEEGLRNTLNEYYEMFPEQLLNLPEYMQNVLKGSNSVERGSAMLKDAADAGYISEESAEHFNRIEVYVLQGMLDTYKDTYKQDDVAESATREFMDTITFCARHMLNPGYTIFGLGPL
jgi:AcrR family transcriptional regulator